MKTAYIIFGLYREIKGVTLSVNEALYQIWELCTADRCFSEEEILEENGYDTLEELEKDWFSGAFGNELWDYSYEEYQVSNDLGLE